jgi:flagellar protein FliO/FliZ
MNGAEVGMPTGYGLYLLQTLLALGAVSLLAYVVLRYGLKRVYGRAREGAKLRVIEHLPLEPRRSVYLVEVGERYLLLGTGERGVSFLAEVELPEEPGSSLTTSRADRSPDPE